MNRFFVSLYVSLLFINYTYSQESTTFYPNGDALAQTKVLRNAHIPTVSKKMPCFDLSKFLEEDQERKGTNAPHRFGKDFDVNYTLKDGVWESTEEGRIWAICIESKGALSLNFIFENLFLPEGAELYVCNDSRTVLYGPVTSKSITNNLFLTDIIEGEKAFIFLHEPHDNIGESTLTIKKVVHGYKAIYSFETGYGASSSCNIDVACYPDFNNEAGAIGLVISSSGTECGSGALIMSSDMSFKPYFLTAFHCVDDNGDLSLSSSEISNAQNWAFKFNFRKKECGEPETISSIMYHGAILRAGWSDTDFVLMEINGNLRNNSSLYWLGWDKSGVTPTNGTGIHHPRGDIMKISIENDPFTKTGWNGSPHLLYWKVNFDYGIVEEGSSGSPILDQNHRIVGNLRGIQEAPTVCENTIAKYGLLNLSWNGGGTDSSRLSNWLDPISSGISTLDGDHPFSSSISGSSPFSDFEIYFLDYLPSSLDVLWSIDNPAFSISPSNNVCSVTYMQGNQYDIATLTATIMHGDSIITFLTKNIIHIGTISGETVLCDSMVYRTACLPNNYTITWSIDNNAFSINAADSLCGVIYSDTLQHDVAVLSANISKSGETVTTLTKRLVHHGDSLFVEGWQEEEITPNGISPYYHFTIPNDELIDEPIEEEELPDLLPDNEDFPPIGFTELREGHLRDFHPGSVDGTANIYGGTEVRLSSTRFDGMQLNISSLYSPLYSVRSSQQEIRFKMPYEEQPYDMMLNATSPGGCNDFTLGLTVRLLPGDVCGDDEIGVYLSNNQVNVKLLVFDMGTNPSGQGTQPQWNLGIFNLATGTCVYSTNVIGTEATVNTSSFASGIYVVRVIYNNNVYTKKFTKS